MRSLTAAALLGATAGALATYVKSQAEGVLQPWGEKLLPPAPIQKTAVGADPAGHPGNMPPSEVADRALHAVTGDELTDEQRQRVSGPVHWATGIGAGVVYGLLGTRFPVVRAGSGVLFGLAVFGSTHASLLPATGMQARVSQLPRAWWIWEGGSHLVYGLALGSGFTLGERLIDRLD